MSTQEPPAGMKLAGDNLDPNNGNELAPIVAPAPTEAGPLDLVIDPQFDAIDTAIAQCSGAMATQSLGKTFGRGLAMARAIRQITDMITPEMMGEIMWLQNNPLGFLTDKNPARKDKDGNSPTPYDQETVKRCIVEAAIRGVRFVGNEMNIIAGRAYPTLQALKRQVYEFPGLSNLQLHLGIPRTQNGTTVVDGWATWKLNGVPQRLDCKGDDAIPIIVSSASTHDQNLGKARKKLLTRIFEILTGSHHDSDVYDADEIDPSQAMIADARQQDTFDEQRHPAESSQAHDNRPGADVDPWCAIEVRYQNCHSKKDVALLTQQIQKEWPEVDAKKLRMLDQAHQQRVGPGGRR